MDQWTPLFEGAGYEMPPVLAELEEYRERMLVISGLSQNAAGRLDGEVGGHHPRACTAFLTGSHAKMTSGADLQGGHLGFTRWLRENSVNTRSSHRSRWEWNLPRWWVLVNPTTAALTTTRSRGVTRRHRCRWRIVPELFRTALWRQRSHGPRHAPGPPD